MPLPHDHIKPFDQSEKGKKEQVEEMFDRIAGRYDLMNRFLSAGIDTGWRKKAIKSLQADQPRVILDVATGTADMAILTCKMLKPEKVIGIDISAQMLDIGRQKIEKEGLTNQIALLKGDGEAINFPDATFDGIMVAFGVRNFENLEKGLKELLRVLKPGGKLVVLEFSKPKNSGFRKIYNLYMGIVAPQMARWLQQNKEAYEYLKESSEAFPDREHFINLLNNTGFTSTGYKPLSFGICCIYNGRKSVS
ncbi:MAG: bifunctional demethylmenaquinone methyltransferase/2-methoxy-6-polyprenyl-1,4-benzoquinol methylase UbiE [Terrimonas sp.]|nr:bifunctional demethylmenaquinone methyltransferase/2-methoxy-6-polyprenyl-1,4-benzoquinol methylase UbiE [Terrimonas sp.]